MKTMTFRQPVLAATALLMSFTTFAQEENKFEIAPAADLVSSYVWRGVYQTGPSVQPSIALSYAGLSHGVGFHGLLQHERPEQG